MGLRRQAREYALKMLFQIDLGKLETDPVVHHFFLENECSEEVRSYAEDLLRGVWHEKKAIDELLSKHVSNWNLSRLAAVDRNVLRLAAFELQHHPEVPASVVIDEAIEIAKKYCTEESGRFVNGVLDQLPRGLGGGEKKNRPRKA